MPQKCQKNCRQKIVEAVYWYNNTKEQCFNLSCVYQHHMHVSSSDKVCQCCFSTWVVNKHGTYKVGDLVWVKALHIYKFGIEGVTWMNCLYSGSSFYFEDGHNGKWVQQWEVREWLSLNQVYINANDLEPDSSVTDDSLEDCSPEER